MGETFNPGGSEEMTHAYIHSTTTSQLIVIVHLQTFTLLDLNETSPNMDQPSALAFVSAQEELVTTGSIPPPDSCNLNL